VVYAEDTPVGFVMIADEVGSPDYRPHYLWKLLTDERYQRQGFGTATLDLIVEYFRGRPGVEVLSTSAVQGDGSPITFYERHGFSGPAKCPTMRWCFGSSSANRRGDGTGNPMPETGSAALTRLPCSRPTEAPALCRTGCSA
jgi:hypothetical protein